MISLTSLRRTRRWARRLGLVAMAAVPTAALAVDPPAAPASAAKAKKAPATTAKKAPAAAPVSDLKKPAPTADLKKPLPPPPPTPPVPTKTASSADELAPPPPGTRVIEAYGDGKAPPMVEAAPGARPASEAHALVLSLSGGVTVPNAVFRVGPVTTLAAEFQPKADLPVKARLAVGFEEHAGTAARIFRPPYGGYDAHAIDNQDLVPLEVGAVLVPWQSGDNALTVGASYGLLFVMTDATWLGTTRAERGLGHQFALEAGYTRSFGPWELSLKARYAARHTAVGIASSTIELPWYQLGGASLGLGRAL